MNPGGVRADLLFAASRRGEGDGVVTYGEAFTVQPFGNSLVTMTLTGAQIERMLEQQFCGINAASTLRRCCCPRPGSTTPGTRPAIGAADCAAADAVDPASITLDGVPLDPATTYRVTVNSFLADGGDGFTVLQEGTDRLGGAVDLDAFEAYLDGQAGGVAPGPRTASPGWADHPTRRPDGSGPPLRRPGPSGASLQTSGRSAPQGLGPLWASVSGLARRTPRGWPACPTRRRRAAR